MRTVDQTNESVKTNEEDTMTKRHICALAASVLIIGACGSDGDSDEPASDQADTDGARDRRGTLDDAVDALPTMSVNSPDAVDDAVDEAPG